MIVLRGVCLFSIKGKENDTSAALHLSKNGIVCEDGEQYRQTKQRQSQKRLDNLIPGVFGNFVLIGIC